MDFIMLPDNVAAHEPVPDLGGPEWDNKGFRGYDKRQGWDLTALRNGDFSEAIEKLKICAHEWGRRFTLWPGEISTIENSEDSVTLMIGAFFQTWITFGILQEALGRPLSRVEAVKPIQSTSPNSGSTSRSQIVLQGLFAEAVTKGIEMDHAGIQLLYSCLEEASQILQNLAFLCKASGQCVVPTSVHVALSVLVGSLPSSFDYRKTPVPGDLHADVNQGICMPFKRRLIEDCGWCPSMIRRILHTLLVEGLYYASILPRVDGNIDHSKCDELQCVASNIDPNHYQVVHVPRLCRCQFASCDHRQQDCPCPSIGVQEINLSNTWNNESFPLIKFRDEGIEIVPFAPGTEFVSISHVWSEGRGNPQDNSLPRCQLQLIQQYVTCLGISRDTPFWIDTLCVPLRKPLRDTAIVRMAQVYSVATRVLVLSDELLSFDLPSTPDEALFRVFSSQWAARLWTFQEASLSRELVFQFSDQAVSQSALEHHMNELFTNSREKSRRVGFIANNQIRQKPFLPTRDFPLIALTDRLSHRSRSKLSDVAICVSTLLGYGLETVLSVPDEEKMQAFWSCQEKVPTSVLWAKGPRLDTSGYRWALSELLSPSTHISRLGNTAHGAVSTPVGLLVAGVEAVVLAKVLFTFSDRTVLRIKLPAIRQRFFCIQSMHGGREPWTDVQSSWTGKSALLISRSPDHLTYADACLVMLTDTADGHGENSTTTIMARYLIQVIVFVEGPAAGADNPEVNDGFDPLRKALKGPLKNLDLVDIEGRRCTDPSQQWCIS